MILYHAITIYQLLVCCVHRKLYHEDEQSIMILPDFILSKLPFYKDLVKYEIFNGVCLYPYRELGWDEESIVYRQDKVYDKSIGIDIKKFNKVYIAGAQFPFSLYCIVHKIRFDFFEEANGVYLHPENLIYSIKSSEPKMLSVAEKFGLIDGSSEYIDTIYANIPVGQECGENVTRFDIVEEIKKTGDDYCCRLKKFFRMSMMNFDMDDIGILLTQHFVNLKILSREEQKRMYTLTVDYFLSRNRLIVKPHPDDLLDYVNLFPDAIIFPSLAPIELFHGLLEDESLQVISINSRACKAFSSMEIVNFSNHYFETYGNLHKYGFCLFLYREVLKERNFAIKNMGDDGGVLRNLCRDLSDEDYDATRNFFIVDTVSGEIGKVLENQKDFLVAFFSAEGCFEALKYKPDNVIPVKLKVDYCDSHEIQTIYFYTHDSSVMQDIKDISYTKILKYTKGEIKVEEMSEEDIEVAVLKGILEATQRRLEYVLKENDDLKERLQFREGVEYNLADK